MSQDRRSAPPGRAIGARGGATPENCPDVVARRGNRIAAVMLSPRGPLKAKFRNGILGVLAYQKETRQRVLFRKEITSQNLVIQN